MSIARLLLAAAAFAIATVSNAAPARLFAVNPFNNGTEGGGAGAPIEKALAPGDYGFYEINPLNGAIIASRIITVPGRTITGAVALTLDPTTGTAYVVAKASGVSGGGRLLLTVNLDTAVGVEIGNLGDNFSSLAFRSDGQLMGVTGDGATVPETLYLINKATAAKTLATTLGNGADGEVIAYNPNDNSLYHFSGNGTTVYERVLATAPYTVTPISGALGAGGEIFGAVWDPSRNAFLISNISSELRTVTTSGTVSAPITTFPNDLRGMALTAAVADVPVVVPTLDGKVLAALLLLTALAGVFVARRSVQRRG